MAQHEFGISAALPGSNPLHLPGIKGGTKQGESPMRVPLLIAFVLIAGSALAQSVPQHQVVSPQQAKFASSPSVPDCYSFSVVQGDPQGSSSVLLVKVSSGCALPTHWHSANEQATFTSGTAQLKVEGEQPQTVSAGMFYSIPAKHVHQFTCKDSCTFYRAADGPVDIHYVDAAGNEIPAASALAAVGERPGTAVAQK
jgi:quercetin dioxygenase-like cupin family protein